MRNLNDENPQIAHPKNFFPFSLVIPLIAGFLIWALASGAAKEVMLKDNFFAMIGLSLSGLSILAMPLPYFFKWNWETKYFGAPLFCFASASSFGLAPLICMVIYGRWPIEVRLFVFSACVTIILWWCSRFVILYKKIYADSALRNFIYTEEDCAVYYMQRGDKLLIEEKINFRQFPSNVSMVLALAAAFLMVPFMRFLVYFVGIPFAHIFLAVASFPISLMILGVATRLFLVFYYFPSKIKRELGKEVYVDMTSAPKSSA